MSLTVHHRKTVQAIREMRTTGHHPIAFECDDGAIWFCKYILDVDDPHQTDLLYNELIAAELLHQLKIPGPDVGLVKVAEGSFEVGQIPNNAKYLKPGVVCFGSKQLPGDVVDDFWGYPTERAFKKLVNPADLIRVALFDIWVANRDRGKKDWDNYNIHNYNLLVNAKGNEHRLIPIDHAAILGGELEVRQFHPNTVYIGLDNTLFHTRLFKVVRRFLGDTRFLELVDEFFLDLIPNLNQTALWGTINEAKQVWEQAPDMQNRVNEFLWNDARLKRIEDIVRSTLKQ